MSDNEWLAVWDGELPPTPTLQMVQLWAFARWKESSLNRWWSEEPPNGIALLRSLWQAREELFVRGQAQRRGPQEHHELVVTLRYRHACRVCAAAHCAWYRPIGWTAEQPLVVGRTHVVPARRRADEG